MLNRDVLYSTLHNIKSRCYLKTHPKYNYYGGRGIGVCKEWVGNKGFDNFYNWAMASGYEKGLTIDRIDNNKDYCPNNCRWVTMVVQNNNTRVNHYVTYKNETKTVSEWAKQYGMSRNVLNKRIRRGWSFEDAVSKPVRTFKRYSKNQVLPSKDVNIKTIKEGSNG